MTAYRAGNGKFVSRDNPVAVIGKLNARKQAERAESERKAMEARKRNARRRGYSGPLTRAELAAQGYVPTVR
jgi:hypothetical protein